MVKKERFHEDAILITHSSMAIQESNEQWHLYSSLAAFVYYCR